MDSLVDHILLSNIIAIVFLNGKQEAFFFPPTLFFAQFCDIVNLVIFSKKLARLVKFTLEKQGFPQQIVKKMTIFLQKKKHWL